MHNPLLLCCSPIFDLAFRLIKDEQIDSAIEFQQLILSQFTTMQEHILAKRYSQQQIQYAQYALAALIDELVIHSKQEIQQQWLTQTLQLKLFHTQLAGEEFFKRLDTLCASIEKQIDILEIYYICLQFGFVGKYRQEKQTHIQALRLQIKQHIIQQRNTDKLVWQTKISPQQTEQPKVNFGFKLFRFTIGFCLLLYMIYGVLGSYQSYNTHSLLEQYTHRLHASPALT